MNQTKNKIIQILKHHLADELVSIYLFGSHGTEHETKASDIDIAIMCRLKIGKLELWDMTQAIAIALKKDIDLLDLKGVSTVMQMQVIDTGRRIYCTDEIAAEKYADFIFSSYVSLNESRKGILDDIKSRGNIYGG